MNQKVLHLAWILCRTRDDDDLTKFELAASDQGIEAKFEAGWISSQPLTATDLEQERTDLLAIALPFRFSGN